MRWLPGIRRAGHTTMRRRRVKELYNSGITDEFIPPFTVTDDDGHAVGPIRENDVVINFNYRADRARQITRVLARNVSNTMGGLTANGGLDLPKAAELDLEIPRNLVPGNLHYVCMTQYDKNFKLPLVIPPESMDNLLAHLMAKANLRNLRVAETEKYAHVTYFFNGGIEKPFGGEDRVLVPSQKVATYDLAPEMSAAGIADAVVKAVDDTAFDVIIVNFANADMVGPLGQAGADGARGGDGGSRAGPRLQGGEAAGRRIAGYGGPWQRGDADRSGDRRPAHCAHDKSGAVHFDYGRAEWDGEPAAGGKPARHLADDSLAAAPGPAEGDDRRQPAGGLEQLERDKSRRVVRIGRQLAGAGRRFKWNA